MKEKNIEMQGTTEKLHKGLKRLAGLESNLGTLFRLSSRSTQSRARLLADGWQSNSADMTENSKCQYKRMARV